MTLFTALVVAFNHLFLLSSAHVHNAHHHLHRDKRLLFDFTNKPVDVQGVHAFHPPTTGDQRGPCPGLNALANHGYISRDGVASFAEAVSAINEVYGMGLDLATILATMGVVWGGAPVSLDPRFSIGGEDPAVSNLLDGLLGVLGDPQGIEHTHNLIESDSSPTRDDLYVTGDAWTMNLARFKSMLNAIPENADSMTTSQAMADFAAQRFRESVGSNPNFYYGPFTGMVARNAGYLFIVNMFANHSAETGDGTLNYDILRSFFGVSGNGSNMTYNKGWERIPDNWYRIPVDYTLLKLNTDIVSWILRQPVLGSIGGNIGSTNSFAGVDLSDPVTGLTNAPELLESNNLICFSLQVVKLASPTYLNNLYTTLSTPLNLILDALSVPLLDLACPSWNALTVGGKPLWEELQDRFPGAKVSAL